MSCMALIAAAPDQVPNSFGSEGMKPHGVSLERSDLNSTHCYSMVENGSLTRTSTSRAAATDHRYIQRPCAFSLSSSFTIHHSFSRA
jgi:hypothetical protein